jgi:hypothetical protein
MTDEKRQDEAAGSAGMPEMNPPEGGPNADPDTPDPEKLVPPRPGALEGEQDADPKPN